MTDEVPSLKDWFLAGASFGPDIKIMAKMDSEKANQAKKMLRTGKTVKEVAYELNVSYISVYNVSRGRTFKED